MNKLSNNLLNTDAVKIDYNKDSDKLPEKILQFGEGNFLRAFTNWMVDEMNGQNLFNGRTVVVQPLAEGMIDKLNDQDCLYTLYLRGIENGQTIEKKKIITSISRGLNPYRDWQEYLKTAENPGMELIISNTTEAGIEFKKEPMDEAVCPNTFPAKLTLWLYHRYKKFAGDKDMGLIIMPCELNNYNGTKLKECTLEYAEYWNLEDDFILWLGQANTFLSTLVDRIVPGYPRDEIADITEELGYQDDLVDTGEIFHLLVVEGASKEVQEKLPFTKAGLNVVFTDDMQPYHTQKVSILNGAHTGNVLAAHLAGLSTVGEMLKDEDTSTFLNDMLMKEIVPILDIPDATKKKYAEGILERFSNPFIKHALLTISLNSVSKWRVRVLPSMLSYIMEEGVTPKRLVFSLAALIAFYKGERDDNGQFIGSANGQTYLINDSDEVTSFFEKAYATNNIHETVHTVLSHVAFWDEDLSQIPTLESEVAQYLHDIQKKGIRSCIREFNK